MSKIFRVAVILLISTFAAGLNAAAPKVSVIVPVYKTERFLRECLDSILGQSLRDIEVICVNDASPDNCGAILREYAAKDKRVKIIEHGRNLGSAIARNSGTDAAKGEYIAFADSDDRLHPDMLKILYDEIIKGDFDVAICNYFDETPQQRPVIAPITDYKVREHDVSEWITDFSSPFKGDKRPASYLVVWGKLYKRTVTEGDGSREPLRFSPEHGTADDWIFNICARRFIKKYVSVDAKLYFYREYGESLTRSPFSKSKTDGFCKIIEIVRSRPDSAPNERHKNIICESTLFCMFENFIFIRHKMSFDVFCHMVRRVYGLYAVGLVSWDCIKGALAKVWRVVCSVLWK
ncbi:MAG: glycosyltransferase [Holosporaceae bacterium]|jgi:glycosyltransferase involved in cell wall biosynthesis|nr:glycosyltransferase [Holosporaceae bacterium]